MLTNNFSKIADSPGSHCRSQEPGLNGCSHFADTIYLPTWLGASLLSQSNPNCPRPFFLISDLVLGGDCGVCPVTLEGRPMFSSSLSVKKYCRGVEIENSKDVDLLEVAGLKSVVIFLQHFLRE